MSSTADVKGVVFDWWNCRDKFREDGCFRKGSCNFAGELLGGSSLLCPPHRTGFLQSLVRVSNARKVVEGNIAVQDLNDALPQEVAVNPGKGASQSPIKGKITAGRRKPGQGTAACGWVEDCARKEKVGDNAEYDSSPKATFGRGKAFKGCFIVAGDAGHCFGVFTM
ncbi:MAG: hypothetical protein MUE52_05900 [Tabrizicola sp.]|jgi:hypothetical protein|nr:hypothetical protein [Tabrizicola sp.]